MKFIYLIVEAIYPANQKAKLQICYNPARISKNKLIEKAYNRDSNIFIPFLTIFQVQTFALDLVFTPA